MLNMNMPTEGKGRTFKAVVIRNISGKLLLLLKVKNRLRLTKMDREIEDLFNNVNHLIECQTWVCKRVDFLEQKQQDISIRIQNLGFSSYRKTEMYIKWK